MLEPHNLYEVVGSRFGTSFETVDLAPYPVPRTYSLWDKGDQSNFYMNGPKLPSSNDPECCDAARRRRHSLRLHNQELAVFNQPRWLR